MNAEIRPVLLEPASIVLPGGVVGYPEVDRARRDAQAAAAAAAAWAIEPGTRPVRVELELPSAKTLLARLIEGSYSGHPGVTALHVDGGAVEAVAPHRSWMIGSVHTTVPDPLTIAKARRAGGLVMDNVERWDPALADLADLVALALDAHVRISIATGHASLSALGDGYWERPAVLSVGGSSVVRSDVGDLEVRDGEAIRLPGVESVTAGTGVVAALIGIREAMLADFWGSLVHMAGFWPRLRMDLPRDPAQLTEVYGEERPMSAVALALDTVRERLLTEAAAEQCLAWWRANILPASRARLDYDGRSSHVRPLLPGGIGFIEERGGERAPLGAAGGWVFPLCGASAGFMSDLVAGATVDVEALSGGERALVEILLDLGLAVPVPDVEG